MSYRVYRLQLSYMDSIQTYIYNKQNKVGGDKVFGCFLYFVAFMGGYIENNLQMINSGYKKSFSPPYILAF